MGLRSERFESYLWLFRRMDSFWAFCLPRLANFTVGQKNDTVGEIDLDKTKRINNFDSHNKKFFNFFQTVQQVEYKGVE